MEIILTIWLVASSNQPWMRITMDSYRDCRNAVEAVASVMGAHDYLVTCEIDGVVHASASSGPIRDK